MSKRPLACQAALRRPQGEGQRAAGLKHTLSRTTYADVATDPEGSEASLLGCDPASSVPRCYSWKSERLQHQADQDAQPCAWAIPALPPT